MIQIISVYWALHGQVPFFGRGFPAAGFGSFAASADALRRQRSETEPNSARKSRPKASTGPSEGSITCRWRILVMDGQEGQQQVTAWHLRSKARARMLSVRGPGGFWVSACIGANQAEHIQAGGSGGGGGGFGGGGQQTGVQRSSIILGWVCCVAEKRQFCL